MKWMLEFLDDRAERLRRESRRLAEDDRRDEGNLAKIQANVYGIGKSVLQVQGKEKAKVVLVRLQSEWETSLAAAREHDDAKKIAVEEIKLETLAEIRAELEKEH